MTLDWTLVYKKAPVKGFFKQLEEFEYELDTRYGIINFLSCDSVITVTQSIVFTFRQNSEVFRGEIS